MPCILLATDGSQASNRAADVAARLAKSIGLVLWIVNVTDHFGPPPAELEQFSAVEHLSRSEMIEALSTQLLAEAKEQAEKAGVREVRIESRKGDVTRTLIELAEEIGAEAIVVGRRGCGTLAGLLVGSVTQKLVSLASRTVIVVP
ncbi:MAG TPA: universal stress protein [Aliidongia sp.]|nr:universal stress protein [Aliidongia sp.]